MYTPPKFFKFVSRQTLLITGFCFDDSEIAADVYDAKLKNALADITAINKDPANPTDDEVPSEFKLFKRVLAIMAIMGQ